MNWCKKNCTMVPPHLVTVSHRIRNHTSRWLRQKCRSYHSGRGVHGHRPEISGAIKGSTVDEAVAIRNRNAAPNFFRLVESYRSHGHRFSSNPLIDNGGIDAEESEISLRRFPHLEKFSPDGLVYWKEMQGRTEIPAMEAIDLLRKTYTSQTGFEFMHLEEEVERDWFANQVESGFLDPVPTDYQAKLAIEMATFQNFDHFLANKFPNLKRYGGEGAESMVAFFLELLRFSPELGVDHVIIGMPHRGRLNLLTGILQFSPCRMFQKMKGMPEFPSSVRSSGDVLSHIYTSVDLKADENSQIVRVSLLPNPSHLEIVNPMVVGKARAKMKQLNCYDYCNNDGDNTNPRVLPIQIHGDAALAGQGVNQETLGFACVPHFRAGGSIHFIVNNQVGFTTPAERGRSSRYTSDIAKMIGCPVMHVNGDSPEDIIKCTRIALEYRQTFHKDVFLDLMCFRKWGHNELDDPTFTNPLIYKIINSRKSIPDMYSDRLIAQGVLQESYLRDTIEQHTAYLNEELKKADSYQPPQFYLQNQWSGISQAEEVITEWDTGLEIDLLKYIGHKSVQCPSDFNLHPHLAKTFVKNRLTKINEGEKIDWATAEAMAIGSLLYQGFHVRLSGEDVGRGTFSHRHAMLVDQSTGEINIPLNSLVAPNEEAQFGDFFNGAQIPFDTMIGSGETKWLFQTGMVILLPHGMDGAGPEHSSCRLERFLQLTDSSEEGLVDGDYNNMQVVHPSTPANYFHLLRRQMIRNFRKPLVVVAPKTLLRLSAAQSTLSEMAPGTTFLPVIDDPVAKKNPQQVKKIIFVSGRHFYTLDEKRNELKIQDVAIIRLESLCPFPVREIQKILTAYSNADGQLIWSQEEHRNMGAWSYIKPRFNFVGRDIKYKGRSKPLAAPAVGVGKVHRAEVEQIINSTFNLI